MKKLTFTQLLLAAVTVFTVTSLAWFLVATRHTRLTDTERKQLIADYEAKLERFKAIQSRTNDAPERQMFVPANIQRIEAEISRLKN